MALPSQQRDRLGPQPGDTLVVVHDFDARSSDELSLRKSERVELVELDDGFGDGWYLGRHLTRGDTGLFPGVYTTKLTSNAPAIHATAINGPTIQVLHSPKSLANQSFTSSSSERRNSRDQESDSPQQNGGFGRYNAPLSYDGPQSSSHAPNSVHLPAIQRTIGQTLSEEDRGQDSPVMNETLSVIEEHIDDLRTPRQSLAPQQPMREDSASDYSKEMDRASFVAGTDGDSDGAQIPTEADVRGWDHKQTTAHLRWLGVDERHCDIFEEQEIGGEVLLDMDQSFLFLKEYDFGVMGRRLKTWHKIRDFQNQVRGTGASPSGTISAIGPESPDEGYGTSQNRPSHSTLLPRIPSLMENPGLTLRQSVVPGSTLATNMPAPLHMQTTSNPTRSSIPNSTPPSPWRASMIAESPSRPSAALIREISHSRRHSLIDFGLEQPTSSISLNSPHKHQNSYDRSFSMMSGTPTSANTTAPSLGLLNRLGSEDMLAPQSYQPGGNADLDRGYFSGNEVDNRKHRSTLRKRDSALVTGHARQASNPEAPPRVVNNVKAHTRYSSVDSTHNFRPMATSPAAQAYHSSKKGYRSTSTRAPPLTSNNSMLSPTVTNLEDMSSPSLSSRVSSPNIAKSTQDKARKLFGLRATSDAVTGGEKALAGAPATSGTVFEKTPVDSPTPSSTGSAQSRSFEIDNTDNSSRGTEAVSNPLVARTSDRTMPKNKRQTSAYTHGLMKVSPVEARKDCDHYGWMRKKSSGIMTTWKPRFFVLRGRRLSYYYAETDLEERGIIDISGHKVLVANSEPITNLHAQITGAAASPPSAGIESKDALTGMRSPGSSPFYFKLVPPKTGLSRAVQFTRPTVHYFQCSGLADGRKWMGEIMKATIEHDLGSFETTNKQKTITLAKARARKERPPFLGGPEETNEVADTELEEEENPNRKSGLNIQGLELSLGPSSPFEISDPLVTSAETRPRTAESGHVKEEIP